MYVCICNAVTDHAIREAVDDGVRHFADLQARTGCSTTCGCCEGEARHVLREAILERRSPLDAPLTCAA